MSTEVLIEAHSLSDMIHPTAVAKGVSLALITVGFPRGFFLDISLIVMLLRFGCARLYSFGEHIMLGVANLTEHMTSWIERYWYVHLTSSFVISDIYPHLHSQSEEFALFRYPDLINGVKVPPWGEGSIF